MGTEPPKAVTARGCGYGATISAPSPSRSQASIAKGSFRTLANPFSERILSAHKRALASASLPASRGPTSVVSDVTIDMALLPANALARSTSACARLSEDGTCAVATVAAKHATTDNRYLDTRVLIRSAPPRPRQTRLNSLDIASFRQAH